MLLDIIILIALLIFLITQTTLYFMHPIIGAINFSFLMIVFIGVNIWAEQEEKKKNASSDKIG